MKPHAIWLLWPITTPGTPEKPNPETSKGQVSLTGAQRSPIWCHTLGMSAPRCGSFARSGIPDSVSSPETTHEFEPMPSPTSPTIADTASTTLPTSFHSTEAVTAVGSGTRLARPADGLHGALDRGDGRHDHGVPVERIGRVELGDLLGGEVGRHERPLGLGLDVAAKVPCHGLEPRDRVGGCPRLDLVVGVLQPEDGVLERGGGPLVIGEVGVDAVGVGVVVAAHRLVQRLHLLLGDLAPAERAKELVGRDLRFAEQLGDAARGDVPAEVHLPEAVLGVDVPLRVEEVVRGIRRDDRDAERIALHRHLGVETLSAISPDSCGNERCTV